MLAEGWADTAHRRFVQGSFWAVLMVGGGCDFSPTSPIAIPMGSILVGVSIHGTPPPSGLDLIRRDEDRLTWLPDARATGAQPIAIVGYGTHESIPERCALAHAEGAWIELWNEPNLPEFWGYDADSGRHGYKKPDPQQWVELVRACRERAPGAVIMGPALGGSTWDWAYLRDVVAAGAMQHLDVVTVHGYATSPDELSRDIAKVRAITGASRVAISEWGIKNNSKQPREIERALAASVEAGLEFAIFYGPELSTESVAVLQRWASK